ERKKLGLDPDLRTGLVLFGGQGSSAMLEIAKRVTAKAQFIFICGRNETLAAELRSLETPYRKFVEGFTNEIPYYMHLADFFIGKPGPGSISEALAMQLPVMVERNAATLPQERYNTDWIREKEVGVVLKSFNDIDAGLRELLDPARFSSFRSNASEIKNRALFEIPDILERLMRKRNR
ncbi:MAG TPA: glycosyltransferase, partial [Bryobacteraceae bacterium]|nr:glycosyltransferase [Bryobacteraceae bacterium]